MSVRFDAAADRLLRTTNLLDYNSTYTWMAWVYMVSDLNAVSSFYSINDNDASDADQIRTTSTGTLLQLRVANSGVNTTANGTNISTGTWYHFAMVRENTTSLKFYLNGVLDITNTANVSTRTDAVTRMEMGAIAVANNNPSDTRVAHIKIWTVALTINEVVQEMYSIFPELPDSLNAWYPTFSGSGERNKDYSGNGRDWTESGTLTEEADPGISGGMNPIFIPFFDPPITEQVSLTLAKIISASDLGLGNTLASHTANRVLATVGSGTANTLSSQNINRVMRITDSGIVSGFGSISLNDIRTTTQFAGASSNSSSSLNRILGLTGYGLANTYGSETLNKVLSISNLRTINLLNLVSMNRILTDSESGIKNTPSDLTFNRILILTNSAYKDISTSVSLNKIDTVSESGIATSYSSNALSKLILIDTSSLGNFYPIITLNKIVVAVNSAIVDSYSDQVLNKVLVITDQGIVTSLSEINLDKFNSVSVNRLVTIPRDINLNITKSITDLANVESFADIAMNTIKLIDLYGGGNVVSVDISINRVMFNSIIGNSQAIAIINILKSLGINVISQADSYANNLIEIEKDAIIDSSAVAETTIDLTVDFSTVFRRRINLLADLILVEKLATSFISRLNLRTGLNLSINKVIVVNANTIIISTTKPVMTRVGDKISTIVALDDLLSISTELDDKYLINIAMQDELSQ